MNEMLSFLGIALMVGLTGIGRRTPTPLDNILGSLRYQARRVSTDS